MARSVMRLDDSELKCFHANYIYMWKKLNTAPYYVSGFGESPSWIRGSELLPSYVNLSKCMNTAYVPSINLVNKIVHFYNANISPAIDTYTFLHDYLESGDKGRTALACVSFKPYCGVYYGYYYSEVENERCLRGALLRIFECDGELRTRFLFDITSDADLQSTQLHKLLNDDSVSPESFVSIRDSLPLSKRLMSFCTGSGKVSPGVLSLQFQCADRDGVYISLYLPTDSNQTGEFVGGLGIAVTVTPSQSFQFCRIGFEKSNHKDLHPMSLEDSNLNSLLSINKGCNEHVMMSPADNTAWINYMVLKDQQ